MDNLNNEYDPDNFLSSKFNISSNCQSISNLHSFVKEITMSSDQNYNSIFNSFFYSFTNSNSYSLSKFNTLNLNVIMNNFNLLNLNCRSLFNKMDELEIFLDCIKIDFDVIALTETWLKPHNDKYTNLHNYQTLTTNRIDKKGGGLAFFIKNDINFVHKIEFSRVTPDFEIDVVLINKFNTYITIVNVYRPPNANFESFIDYMDYLMTSIIENNKIIYVTGDFNTNFDSPTPQTLRLLQLLSSYSLLPTIGVPTRTTGQSSTIIDNIFTNNWDPFQSGTILADLSDHFPIFVSQPIKIKHFGKTNNMVSFYNFCEKNLNKLIEALYGENWLEVTSNVDPNNAFNKFLYILNKYFKKFCPLTRKKKKNFKTNKPWITQKIKIAIRKKLQLFKKYKKSHNIENFEKFKVHRNYVNNLIKYTKKVYFENAFRESLGDAKSTWLNIKILINKNHAIKYHPMLINGVLIDDPHKISNSFNNYFINLFNSESEIDSNFKKFLSPPTTSSLFFYPVSSNEILLHTKSLSNSKTLDFHNLSNNILKKLIGPLAEILTFLFNISISSGTFFDSMKISKVIPIFKSGSHNEISDYRPISIVSPLSKIFEKIIKSRLILFLDNLKILNDSQYGFRKKMSTELALMKFCNDTTNYLNNSKNTLAVFLDFSKAFDSVNHQILIDKLNHYGIRGTTLSLINSYLSNRTQYVQYNSENSNILKVTSGVPQGSVLGPLLFIIFINDIINTTNNSEFIMFADDCTLYSNSTNITDLITSTNLNLKTIYQWSLLNKIYINMKKTKFIFFTHTKGIAINNIDIKINNVNIERVDTFKLLGVIIDSRLNFKSHINHVISKITISMGILFRIKPFLNRTTLKSLYYALVYSHLYYCNLIWGSANKTDIQNIYTIQKRIIKFTFTTSSRYDHISDSDTFYKNNLLSIFEINSFKTCLLIHRIIYNKLTLDQIFMSIFSNTGLTNYPTRNKNTYLLQTLRINNKLSSRNICFYGPILWNKLPLYLKIITSYNIFKKQLKTFYICFT